MRTWFITGCSTGLGRAIAEEVLARGERACVTARKPDSLRPLVSPHGDRALALALDVTCPEIVDAAVRQAEERFGSIDILVNNAGAVLFSALEEATMEQVRAQFETNFFGMLAVTRAALPRMRQRRAGHIINISSMTALHAPPGMGYYSASKAAMEAVSDALALELAPLGIRVTIVEPGGLRTEVFTSMTQGANRIADYEAAVGPWRQRYTTIHGKEPNDPYLAARAIIEVIGRQDPPLRLPLGVDALNRIRGKLASIERDMLSGEAAARGTACAT